MGSWACSAGDEPRVFHEPNVEGRRPRDFSVHLSRQVDLYVLITPNFYDYTKHAHSPHVLSPLCFLCQRCTTHTSNATVIITTVMSCLALLYPLTLQPSNPYTPPRSQEPRPPDLDDHRQRRCGPHHAQSGHSSLRARPPDKVVHNPNLERAHMTPLTVPIPRHLRVSVDGEIDARLRRARLARVPEEQRLFRRHALAVREELDSGCQLTGVNEACRRRVIVSASSARGVGVGGVGVGWRRFQQAEETEECGLHTAHHKRISSYDSDATGSSDNSRPPSTHLHSSSVFVRGSLRSLAHDEAILTLVHTTARP